MVIDIKLCRFDNIPWGFRLVGGSDFDYPLTVVKVKEESLAEQAGLKTDDIIVRINDDAVSPLTHEEVDKLIRSSGNTLFLGIKRQPENEEQENAEYEYLNAEEDQKQTCESYKITETKDIIIDEKYSEELQEEEITKKVDLDLEVIESIVVKPDIMERPMSVHSEDSERKFVEAEIAAVLSNETEMTKQQNELKISAEPGICMGSDVLCALNDDIIQTEAKKEKENRKWTTFLQKPNRPIPKSKQQVEEERRKANAYKVTIVKSKRRSITSAVNEERSKENAENTDVMSECEHDIPTSIDSEVPNLEEEIDSTYSNGKSYAEIKEMSDEEKDNDLEDPNGSPEGKGTQQEEEKEEVDEEEAVIELPAEADSLLNQKTEEELALEQQLADVQKQLAALANLPSTIQVTLDSVTRQLIELIPVLRLQQQTNWTEQEENRIINIEKIDEAAQLDEEDDNEKDNYNYKSNGDIELHKIKNSNVSEKLMYEKDDIQCDGDKDEANLLNNEITKQIVSDTNDAYNTIDNNSINKQRQLHHPQIINEMVKDKANADIDDDGMKKQKRHDVIEELAEHLQRVKNPKRTKRAFGPLTPSSDRPLVLPGGRRWYRPKDAYNDEFIAETLTAQTELIAGTALGNYESLPLNIDPRVNFMKYQKPEKKIDLKRSEVYKVIHHLDRQPVRGIEVRPPIVPAEMDIRKAIHS